MSLLFSLTALQAQFYYADNVINVPEFSQQIETIGREVQEKTKWNLYLLTVDDINEHSIVAYEKKVAQNLQSPFMMLVLAVKQQQVDIYGSEGFDAVIDKESILRDRVYPILGSAIKSDVRQKYLAAMQNGYAEMAETVADHHNVTLESAIGNANVTTVNVLRTIFYGVIFGALGWYLYLKFKRKTLE